MTLFEETDGMGAHVLRPYDRREALSLRRAAEIAGRSESTVRTWCAVHDIGRRVVNGKWQVSAPALQMLLDGDGRTLAAYLAGDRVSPSVAAYFERCGLASLTL
jgi:hypothetical protein